MYRALLPISVRMTSTTRGCAPTGVPHCLPAYRVALPGPGWTYWVHVVSVVMPSPRGAPAIQRILVVNLHLPNSLRRSLIQQRPLALPPHLPFSAPYGARRYARQIRRRCFGTRLMSKSNSVFFMSRASWPNSCPINIFFPVLQDERLGWMEHA